MTTHVGYRVDDPLCLLHPQFLQLGFGFLSQTGILAQLQDLLEVGNGRSFTATGRVRQAPHEIGRRVPGVQLDALVVVSDGAGIVAFVKVGIPAVVPGCSQCRLKLDGLVEFSDGPLVIAQLKIS